MTSLAINASCQVDSLSVDEPIDQAEEITQSPVSVLRPKIGFGIGSFAFFGETGSGYRSNNIFTTNPAFSFKVDVPLQHNLNLSFHGLKTNLEINEPGLNLLNNFRSEITGGTVILSYNFEDFLPKRAYVQPFIGTGISSFEFLTKGDLYDSNGFKYHLWTNGNLMSLPQDSPDAHEAIMLKRDYVFETDLRGLNTEGRGSYTDNAISIPLSIGMNFKFSEHITGQLASTAHFALNDMVDNSSMSSTGNKRDMFLHTALSLSYDLFIPVKNKLEFDLEFETEEEFLADFSDSDKDGVDDLDDDCLGHPEGIAVDERGCPLDEDLDGIPDYKDDEPMTPEGTLVDQYGVTIDDNDLLDKYIYWIDSLDSQTLYSKVEGEKSKDYFSVLVIPPKDGFNQDEINSLLSEESVRPTEENEDGFLVGEYETLPEAMDKQKQLEENGITGELHKENSEGSSEEIKSSELNEAKVSMTGEEVSPSTLNSNVVYRVQVGAFKYDLSENIFSSVPDLLVLDGDDGLTRYMSDSYDNPMDAAKRRVDLLLQGFEGSFITAYQNGKRISLSSAGLTLAPGALDLTEDVENNSLDKESIKFQIQLGEFEEDIPTETLEKYLELGKVKPIKQQVVTKYVTGEFDSLEEAEAFLAVIQAKGLDGSQILGMFEGELISLEDAMKILQSK